MIKYSASTLERLEELALLAGYTVRNEKGNFKNGSCVLEEGKLIVLNKFAAIEVKISFLINAINELKIDETILDERRLKFLHEIRAIEAAQPAAKIENA